MFEPPTNGFGACIIMVAKCLSIEVLLKSCCLLVGFMTVKMLAKCLF